MNFSIERKGYSKNDVNNFLRTQELTHARELQTLSMRIEELKAKTATLEAESASFLARERNVNEALIQAIERAKEMDSTSKIRYALEGERLKLFEQKWLDYVKKTLVSAKIKNEMAAFLQNANREICIALEKNLNIQSEEFQPEPKPARVITMTPAERQYLSEKNRLSRAQSTTVPTLEDILNGLNG